MSKSNVHILAVVIEVTVAVSLIVGVGLSGSFKKSSNADPFIAADHAINREAVSEIAREAARTEIASAGLDGKALNAKMEGAIIDFIKSRASKSGSTAASNHDAPQPSANVNIEPINSVTEPVAGNPSARYQLIVFSDYECPFCKRFDPTLEKVIKRYSQSLAVTLRNYPLPFHGEAAVTEAIAARCAFKLGGNATFWSYSSGIFDRTQSNGAGLGDDGLMRLAADNKLDAQAFGDCLANNEHVKGSIKADRTSANAAGVRGTPTSVLLDTRTGSATLIRGAQPLSAMTSALDNLLGAPKEVVQ